MTTKTLDQLEEEQPREKLTESTLDNVDTELKKASQYRKIEAGETAIFEFDLKDKLSIVEGEYEGQPTTRIEFLVIEPAVDPKKKKKLRLSPKHSAQLRALLKKGFTVIEVSRKGSGRNDTQYTYTPVPTGAPSS